MLLAALLLAIPILAEETSATPIGGMKTGEARTDFIAGDIRRDGVQEVKASFDLPLQATGRYAARAGLNYGRRARSRSQRAALSATRPGRVGAGGRPHTA